MAPPPPTQTSTPPSTQPKKKLLLTYLVNIFYAVNALLFLSGCGVMGVGIWIIFYKHEYKVLVKTLFYSIISWVLVAVGVFIIIVAPIGPFAARFRTMGVIFMYIFSLLLILLLEFMVGSLASVYWYIVEFDMSHSLPEIFRKNYGKIPEFTKAINDVQQNFKCCGSNSFEDWLEIFVTHVPDSCCKDMSAGCGGPNFQPDNISEKGCIRELVEELSHIMSIVSTLTLVLTIVPIICVMLAYWIYILMKDRSLYNESAPEKTNPM